MTAISPSKNQSAKIAILIFASILALFFAAKFVVDLKQYGNKNLTQQETGTFKRLLQSLDHTAEGSTIYLQLSNDFYVHVNEPKDRHFRELLAVWSSQLHLERNKEFLQAWDAGNSELENYIDEAGNLYTTCEDDLCSFASVSKLRMSQRS